MASAMKILSAAVVLFTSAVRVEAAEASNRGRIAEIAIEGLRRVDKEAVLSKVKSKVGGRIDSELATEDLHALWNTGFFRDVRVERERIEGGWRLIFVVEEKPSIREVKLVGHDDLSEDDVKGVVDVRAHTILNVELLKRNVAKIKDLYVQKGYYLAEVNYRVQEVPGSPHEVDVYFDIVENPKVLVRKITFIGNEAIAADELKGIIQTREGSELSWVSQVGTYKEEFFETDLYRIQAYYYDQGYVTVKVGEPTQTISSDRRHIYLSIPLVEGEQYSIGKISFSGEVELRNEENEVLIDEEMLRPKLDIESGAVFNRTALFADIQELTDAYRDHGYAYANVTPNSIIDDEDLLVDLDLEVERGEIVYFERIEIVGNTRTRDKVIRRELRIFEGERFSATAMKKSEARIYQMGWFETVNVSSSRGSEPNMMNVTVEVKEKSTGTFQLGAGFSSVEHFIAMAQISQDNFLGQGWLLSLSAQLSFGEFARRLGTFQFYDRYFLDTDWSFGMDAYVTERYYRDFQRNSAGGSTRVGYPLTHDFRLSAGYTLEQIEIRSGMAGGNYQEPALFNLNRDGLNSAMSLSVTYDTRDNRLFPTSGQFHLLTGEISDKYLGSAPGMAYRRLQLFLRYYYPLPLSFVFKINVQLGAVFGVGGNPAPISERFFPGGIYDVRGFEERGLGPTVPALRKGDPVSPTGRFNIGGNKQAVFNLEIEVPIIPQAGIKAVVFADAGNAYDDTQNFFYINTPRELQPNAYVMRSNRRIKPPAGLYYSFGFGFRWLSPMGPLRFEWGIPITKKRSDDRNIIFQFTIGNFF